MATLFEKGDSGDQIKDVLLEFLIKSQNHFRDKDPSIITLLEAIHYINKFYEDRCLEKYQVFRKI